jgi:hypothetical protein
MKTNTFMSFCYKKLQLTIQYGFIERDNKYQPLSYIIDAY